MRTTFNSVGIVRGPVAEPQAQDAAARQNRDQTPVLEGAAEGELAHFR